MNKKLGVLMENRKARFDYEITEEIEAGVVLQGWEVKSIRAKHGNMKASWVKISNGEAFIVNFKITLWKFGNTEIQNEIREKKLLLHKKELIKIEKKIKEKKISVVPLKIYFKKGKIKCLIGLGKGRNGMRKNKY